MVSLSTPAADSSFSNSAWLTMSRRTRSLRSLCHEKFTAPGMWPRSYRPGFTLTSITRSFGLRRFFSSQSVETSGPLPSAEACAKADGAVARKVSVARDAARHHLLKIDMRDSLC
ncbi:hypothetical protein D9M68_712770 [compost metagenome]